MILFAVHVLLTWTLSEPQYPSLSGLLHAMTSPSRSLRQQHKLLVEVYGNDSLLASSPFALSLPSPPSLFISLSRRFAMMCYMFHWPLRSGLNVGNDAVRAVLRRCASSRINARASAGLLYIAVGSGGCGGGSKKG